MTLNQKKIDHKKSLTDNKLTFDWPIIGHKNIIHFLEKSILNQNLSHAYLFTGPKHLGKKKMAELLITNVLCQGIKRPCGQCLHCRQLKSGFHPDIFIIKKETDKSGKIKKNISIEQIRPLKKSLATSSFLNSYKFALINEAEYLSEGASNALLKTLEEPEKKTILILIANEPDKILPTIKSRCQVVQFLPVTKKEIADYLLNFSAKPNLSQTLANFSQGRPGVAIKFLNRQDLFKKHNQQTELFLDLINQNLAERFKAVNEVINFKNESDNNNLVLEDLLNKWTLALRDVILIKNMSAQFVANQFLIKKMENIKFNQGLVLNWLSAIERAKNNLKQNINPKLILENLVLIF